MRAKAQRIVLFAFGGNPHVEEVFCEDVAFEKKGMILLGTLVVGAGLAQRHELGRGELYFVPDMAKVHDFLIERLRRIPDFLRGSCTAELA